MSSHTPLVDLSAQDDEILDEISAAIAELLESGDWILGEQLAQFEAEFAAYCESAHAVGTDSGLSALELALRAFGIRPGDEVITAANTFVATAFAISHTGAMPVFVDVDPLTYTLDPLKLERALTARTRAIVPVHLYGHPADMDPIVAFADEHDLVVIEDACQAHGAFYRGRRVGSLGDAAAFSFYPSKNLGALGDGGAVVTDDEEIADAIRVLRHYGQREKNRHVTKGFNKRLDTLHAAVLRTKLNHLDERNARRRANADLYDELLGELSVQLKAPRVAPWVEPVWHLYVVRVPNRDVLRAFLDEREIGTGIHYPLPVHLQPAYRDHGYGPGDFPLAEAYADEILSLPMYPSLDAESIERVVEAIAEFYAVETPVASALLPLAAPEGES